MRQAASSISRTGILSTSIFILLLMGCCSSPAAEKTSNPSLFHLNEGRGVDVCETYAKYLATLTLPPRCDRDIPPQFSQLRKPDWKNLDVDKNKLLILRIANYLQIPRDEKATAPFIPIYQGPLNDYKPPIHARLAVAKFDIDNDDRKETVVRYRSFMCQAWDIDERAPHWYGPLVVLDESGKGINVEKTTLLMQNSGKVYVANYDEIENAREKYLIASKKAWTPDFTEYDRREAKLRKKIPRAKFEFSRYAPGSAIRMGYDAFEYGGDYYLDQWNENKGEQYQNLTIYKIESDNAEEICRFQYNIEK